MFFVSDILKDKKYFLETKSNKRIHICKVNFSLIVLKFASKTPKLIKCYLIYNLFVSDTHKIGEYG